MTSRFFASALIMPSWWKAALRRAETLHCICLFLPVKCISITCGGNGNDHDRVGSASCTHPSRWSDRHLLKLPPDGAAVLTTRRVESLTVRPMHSIPGGLRQEAAPCRPTPSPRARVTPHIYLHAAGFRERGKDSAKDGRRERERERGGKLLWHRFLPRRQRQRQ